MNICVFVKLLSHFQLFVTPWILVHQAPLSMEFSRQEYWSGLPFPSPGYLPDSGPPALQIVLYHLSHQESMNRHKTFKRSYMVLSSKFARWLGWKNDSGKTAVFPQNTRSTEGSFIPVHFPESIVLRRWWVGWRALIGAISHVSAVQPGAPNTLARPKPAMTSAPGTDQSCPSKRATLSRSLTRRGSRAGGEGRSTAGWVGVGLGCHSGAVLGDGLERVGRGASLVGKEEGTEISCVHLAFIY